MGNEKVEEKKEVTAEEAFMEEMGKDDPKIEEKKSAPDQESPDMDTAPIEEKTEKQVAPETKEEKDKPAISDDDKAILAAYDFKEEDFNPKLVTALRRAEKEKQQERSRADFFGKSNKDLSDKLKAFTRSEASNMDIVKDRIKTRLSKIPKDKLSEHARNLLDDPVYLEAQAAMEVVRMTEDAPAETAQESDQPKDAANNEQLAQAAKSMFEEVKKSHPDITDIYSKNEFYLWLKSQDRAVQAKYFEYSAPAHVDLANRYKVYRKAEQAAAEIATSKNEGTDAFSGHGATGTGRRVVEKELTPEQEYERLMIMPDEEFKREDKRVLSGGRVK